MNFGISTLIYVMELFELFQKERRVNKLYTTFIDPPINFALENNFRSIEIITFNIFTSDLIWKFIDKIQEKIKVFDSVTYHLPYGEINICALHDTIRKQSIKETKEHIKIAKNLGIQKLVLHPGSYASSPGQYRLFRDRTKKISKKSILELESFSKKYGLELCLENLPHEELLFRKPEEFEYFIEKGLNLTLDTSHTLTCGINPVSFIHRFGNKIKHVHLADGFKNKPDYHYALGEGELDYEGFLGELRRMGYSGDIILEMKSVADVVKSINLLKGTGYL